MELIINIPEEDYERLKEYKKAPFRSLTSRAYEVIANGTPLPKGHGRLIDENELLKMTNSYKSELGRLKADPVVKCGVETIERFIKEMPIIIEADKEQE